VESSHLEVIYDDDLYPDSPLTGVDNVVVSRSGDLYVAEDGGDMRLCFITPERVVAPFLQVVGQEGSEFTGPAFSPDGQRLYFSSQRGSDGQGLTYEVRGPFR
jgi:secreted PhoX family phosphatase